MSQHGQPRQQPCHDGVSYEQMSTYPNFQLHRARVCGYDRCLQSKSADAIYSRVGILTCFQGPIGKERAFQYWPATRAVVTNLIAISPNLHCTVLASVLCLELPCPPAVVRQEYNSKIVATLREGGGESTYLLMTSAYGISAAPGTGLFTHAWELYSSIAFGFGKECSDA